MSSMLYQILMENRLQRNSGFSAVCTGTAAQLLKTVLFVLIIATLFCTVPGAAHSADTGFGAEAERISYDLTLGLDRNGDLLLKKSAENNPCTVSTVREKKSRNSSKKNQKIQPDYLASADKSGDAYFIESPVVTGIHLPDGVSGLVSLTMEPQSAGPNCREVYTVFSLAVEDYPAGQETIIRYTLPLTEIEDKGHSPEDIQLILRENGSWTKLSTQYYMDDKSAFFESLTTAPGLFAIVSEDCIRKTEPVTIRSNFLESGPVTLEITPVSILTHPVSYTTPAG